MHDRERRFVGTIMGFDCLGLNCYFGYTSEVGREPNHAGRRIVHLDRTSPLFALTYHERARSAAGIWANQEIARGNGDTSFIIPRRRRAQSAAANLGPAAT